jgi:hypothetical protein
MCNMYTKTKYKLKDEDKSGVIYQLNCIGDQVLGQSCKKVYIGETKKKLSVRIRENKRDNINKEKPGNKTAPIQHSKDAKHTFDFERPLVLNSENYWYNRKFLELSYIQFNRVFNFLIDVSVVSNLIKPIPLILSFTFSSNQRFSPLLTISNGRYNL